MKRITALLHAHRVSDIVHALESAGERRLSISPILGLLAAANAREVDFSVEFGERLIREVQLDVFCEDAQVDTLVDLIRLHGRAGLPNSGWVFVAAVESGVAIH